VDVVGPQYRADHVDDRAPDDPARVALFQDRLLEVFPGDVLEVAGDTVEA
jgi:hypothetical protein